MSFACRFIYSPSVSTFLSTLVDQDPNYLEATMHLEYFLQHDINIGDPIDRAPLVFRRFVVKLPHLRELAFYYIYAVREGVHEVRIIRVEFAEDTPL